MQLNKLVLDEVDISGKRVLMRVDFNVPLDDSHSKVANNLRIVAAVPSIRYVLDRGHSVVLMSHWGRPNGRYSKDFSLRPVADELAKILGREVNFLADCVGPEVEAFCQAAPSGSVILLENLRFHPEEEGIGVDINMKEVTPSSDDIKKFRASLTRLGDVFVNDAFAAAHRAHSSIVGINLLVRAAGFLVKKELDYFGKVLDNPKRPFLVILGGSKVHDKMPLIFNLLDRADEMIISGALAYTFVKVLKNMEIAESLYDEEGSKTVGQVLAKAAHRGVKLHFSLDFKTADRFSKDAKIGTATVKSGIQPGWRALDIGEETIAYFSSVIERANTILWNGPVGKYDFHNYSKGSQSVLESICRATDKGAISILCGGDTATCAENYAMMDRITYVSTGGGASLMLLEGSQLPGITALTDTVEL